MLRPRKHLSKKELKEDKLVTFYAQLTAWLENYKMYLVAGIAALAVIVLGVYFYSQSSKSAEKDASVELTKATRAYESSDLSTAIPMLTSLVEKYGHTASGNLGRFYLANALFQNKEFDKAKAYYDKFASSFKGDDYFRSAAFGGVAACLEEKKQYEDAAKAYERAAEKFEKSAQEATFLFKAGRCYLLANKAEKAKGLFQKIVDGFPKAPERDEALVQLSLLGF